mmetsp:Transcript_16364/g.50018  ORF Transcript_16364/g.50018 Transcript_16364/m.50018 type:complete len:952 (+) Transcript_16364:187-3042(+)
MAAPTLDSAANLCLLLSDDDTTIQEKTLLKIARVVDHYWAEVSEYVSVIEELSEDEAFPNRTLAAHVASKCFFHLEEYDDALRLALASDTYFNVNERSEYVGSMISRCIDRYIAERSAAAAATGADGTEEAKASAPPAVDVRMEAIMEQMFQRCYADGAFTQAIGIAMESRRLDKLEEAISRSAAAPPLLKYALDVSATLVHSKEFREQVLERLLALFRANTAAPDYLRICQVLQRLHRPEDLAAVLLTLVHGSDRDALVAYQVALDVLDSGDDGFVKEVADALNLEEPEAKAESGEAKAEGAEGDAKAEGEGDAMETEAEAPAAPVDPVLAGRQEKLRMLFKDTFPVDLRMQFLNEACDTDLVVLGNIKTKIEHRSSVLHNAAVVCHGYLQAGTAHDQFLRNNLEWMGNASHWAKFTATASIGVIHAGHAKESMVLLGPYLPRSGGDTAANPSPYSEGGSLYALGLVHSQTVGTSANREVLAYLGTQLRDAGPNEPLAHGACLGLGLAALGSADPVVYESLREALKTADAVIGEAAAYGIGLLFAGRSFDEPLRKEAEKELLEYAKATAHEKILRGCAVALALMCYGAEEDCEPLTQTLGHDRDPVLRYGAMLGIGLGYAGTASNAAVKRLLHVAVSDASDDVRRAAIISIGLVMHRRPAQVPRLVTLLAESYNAHVRYGACLAVGIAAAGTGLPEAVDLLEPMLDDVVDFVRQGAMLALAMVYMQKNEVEAPGSKKFRKKLADVVGDKHMSTMSKVGSILAAGLIDAGGRNTALGLTSRLGFGRMRGAVGLVMWLQHWYWYPLLHFLSVSLTPTLTAGLNADLKLPTKFSVTCAAKPSQFAYPKKKEEKKEAKKLKVTTVELSTTAKARARKTARELKRTESSASAMDVDTDKKAEEDAKGGAEEGKAEAKDEDKMDTEGEGEDEAKDADKKDDEPEPTSFTLGNLARL